MLNKKNSYVVAFAVLKQPCKETKDSYTVVLVKEMKILLLVLVLLLSACSINNHLVPERNGLERSDDTVKPDISCQFRQLCVPERGRSQQRFNI